MKAYRKVGDGTIMNWLDIVILIALAISIFSGLKSGLIKSLFSLVGLIVGVVLAGRFYVTLGDHLGFIHSANAAHIVAFICIFLIVIIIAAILGSIITKVISLILLGWLNRLAGAVFGLIFGMIIVGAILAIWVKYGGPVSIISGSGLASFLLDKFPLVLGLLPQEFDSVKSYFN
jgi:membrane protein required for colicin V production